MSKDPTWITFRLPTPLRREIEALAKRASDDVHHASMSRIAIAALRRGLPLVDEELKRRGR